MAFVDAIDTPGPLFASRKVPERSWQLVYVHSPGFIFKQPPCSPVEKPESYMQFELREEKPRPNYGLLLVAVGPYQGLVGRRGSTSLRSHDFLIKILAGSVRRVAPSSFVGGSQTREATLQTRDETPCTKLSCFTVEAVTSSLTVEEVLYRLEQLPTSV